MSQKPAAAGTPTPATPPPLGTYWGTDAERGQAILDYQRNLTNIYTANKAVIRSTWLALTPQEREDVVLRGSVSGKDSFLASRNDTKLGDINLKIPELNLHDLTTNPQHLFTLLDTRSTGDPTTHFRADHAFIKTQTQHHGLQNPEILPTSLSIMFYLEKNMYGTVYGMEGLKRGVDKHGAISHLNMLLEKEWAVPHWLGDLVLQRQTYIYLAMRIMMTDLLEKKMEMESAGGSGHEKSKAFKPKRPLREGGDDDLRTTLSASEIIKGGKNWERFKILVSAMMAIGEENVGLIYVEPKYRVEAVLDFADTLPEGVSDEAGKKEILQTRRGVSIALFESLFSAYQRLAFAEGLAAIVWFLEKKPMEIEHLKDELWAIARRGLRADVARLGRFISTEPGYMKYFVRKGVTMPADSEDSATHEGYYDNNPSVVRIKSDLAVIAKKDPFAAWLLQLCSVASANTIDHELCKSLLTKMKDYEKNLPAGGIKLLRRSRNLLKELEVSCELLIALKEITFIPSPEESSTGSKYLPDLDVFEMKFNKVRLVKDIEGFISSSKSLEFLNDEGGMEKCFDRVHLSFSEGFETDKISGLDGAFRGVLRSFMLSFDAPVDSKEISTTKKADTEKATNTGPPVAPVPSWRSRKTGFQGSMSSQGKDPIKLDNKHYSILTKLLNAPTSSTKPQKRTGGGGGAGGGGNSGKQSAITWAEFQSLMKTLRFETVYISEDVVIYHSSSGRRSKVKGGKRVVGGGDDVFAMSRVVVFCRPYTSGAGGKMGEDDMIRMKERLKRRFGLEMGGFVVG
ncbi:hypothetical protein DFH27DRAFT_564514 [Peziza echinospora]|nr:hypothetical protein DFH27DRAFT_564514 [Peziza echinospora]